MEITNLFKTVIYNTLTQYWYIWTILGLLIILPGIIKIVKPIITKKIDKKLSGFVGEKEVANILRRLDPEKYKVINGLTIYSGKESAQIDHLIISNFGIFVIETKNFEGIIIGEETSNYWTQILYKNRKNFYNPIKQNNWHVRVLEDILKKYSNILYFPIIVFTTSSDLRVKTITDVVKTDDLIKTIRQHRDKVISDIAKDNIYNYLMHVKSRN